eukprot:3327935-Pyramimonas_sp.AAC.1
MDRSGQPKTEQAQNRIEPQGEHASREWTSLLYPTEDPKRAVRYPDQKNGCGNIGIERPYCVQHKLGKVNFLEYEKYPVMA